MKVVLDESGRVEVPECVREQLGVKAGDELTWEKENGGWLLKPRPSPPDPTMADWQAYYAMLTSGQLNPYSGKHVVIFEGKMIAAGDDPETLQARMIKELKIPMERLVVAYVDGGECIVAE
jgi:bifunctional DNA-binding transcriptional regulator/antitoxin component of YhaV-PrlF toxin-antitoxin module